ncbi:MAG TPA: glycosyl transferase family 2, partial [Ruminococcaceae bacterium]|nr:glycosyl transferase family 2 [Oscillospiraceae bacterium]
MKFSACWIVKNEAENIKKSIMSVKACCDEMIVVDTGSNDDTVKIAKECGARVEHFKWISDFSAAKNYALSLAKGDYVIFLDGDEYFDPPLTKKSGREFYKTFKESRADTLRIPRYEMEKEDGSIKGIQAFDRILRRKTVHFENKVHEIPRR